jgi:hypothetical protein
MTRPIAQATMIAAALLILTAPVILAAPVEQIVFYVQ